MHILKLLILNMFLCSAVAVANEHTINLLINEAQFSTDNSLRASAIDTHKDFSHEVEVKNALVRLVQNNREHPYIRMTAVKSLSSVAVDKNIYPHIVHAHDQSNDTRFRSLCLQALYKVAPIDQRVRQGLIANFLRAPAVEIRRASAFGLMNSARDLSVSNALLQVAINPGLDVRQRIEAIKSLYHYKTSELRNNMQKIAENEYDNLEVRVAAIRFMTTYPKNTRARGVLEHLLQRGSSSQIRSMAAQSIRFNLREKDISWFHLSTDPRGNFERDPFNGSEPFMYDQINYIQVNGGGINFN